MDLSFLKNIGSNISDFIGGLGKTGTDILSQLGQQREPEWMPSGYGSIPNRGFSTESKGMMAESLRKQLGTKEEKPKEEKAQMGNVTITNPTPDGGKVTIKIDKPTPTILPEFQGVNQPFQDQIASLLNQAGLSDQANNFINLSARESSLNPSLTQTESNPIIPETGQRSTDWGAFQFNDWWQRKLLQDLGLIPQDLLDPVTAIKAMIELYKRSGYRNFPATAPGLGLTEQRR